MTPSSEDDTPRSLNDLSEIVLSFARDRQWEQFHDPKNLTMALASEVGELAALLRWVPNEESDRAANQEPLRQRIIAEIGDVGILTLLLCNRIGVRFDVVVREKIAENAQKYPAAISIGRADRPL